MFSQSVQDIYIHIFLFILGTDEMPVRRAPCHCTGRGWTVGWLGTGWRWIESWSGRWAPMCLRHPNRVGHPCAGRRWAILNVNTISRWLHIFFIFIGLQETLGCGCPLTNDQHLGSRGLTRIGVGPDRYWSYWHPGDWHKICQGALAAAPVPTKWAAETPACV